MVERRGVLVTLGVSIATFSPFLPNSHTMIGRRRSALPAAENMASRKDGQEWIPDFTALAQNTAQ